MVKGYLGVDSAECQGYEVGDYLVFKANGTNCSPNLTETEDYVLYNNLVYGKFIPCIISLVNFGFSE